MVPTPTREQVSLVVRAQMVTQTPGTLLPALRRQAQMPSPRVHVKQPRVEYWLPVVQPPRAHAAQSLSVEAQQLLSVRQNQV